MYKLTLTSLRDLTIRRNRMAFAILNTLGLNLKSTPDLKEMQAGHQLSVIHDQCQRKIISHSLPTMLYTCQGVRTSIKYTQYLFKITLLCPQHFRVKKCPIHNKMYCNFSDSFRQSRVLYFAMPSSHKWLIIGLSIDLFFNSERNKKTYSFAAHSLTML